MQSVKAVKELMPAFFISHSGPQLLVEQGPYIEYLKEFSKTIKKPKAIVIFSAHWEEPIQTISLVERNTTYHDFSGFPKEFHKVTYTPPGSASLSKEISELFNKNGIKNTFNTKRGLDHCVYTVLKLMYPKEDIPVVSLSINPDLDPQEIYKIGAALTPLREKGVLILGSGVILHNFDLIDWRAGPDAPPAKWAKEFAEWVGKQLDEWNTSELSKYDQTKHRKDAAPTPDHFVPLIYAMGAGSDVKKANLIQLHYLYKTGCYAVWKFD